MSESYFNYVDQLIINELAACVGDNGALYIEDSNTEICIANRDEAIALRDWLTKALSELTDTGERE